MKYSLKKEKLEIQMLGEYEWMYLYEESFNNEPSLFWIIWKSNEEQVNEKMSSKLPMYWTNKDNSALLNGKTTYYVLKRKEDWRERLLESIDKHTSLSDVSIIEALFATYDIKSRHSHKECNFRFYVNGDNSRALDMNDFMSKVIFPIENIKGDVYYVYKYKEQYIVIREFLNNKIYILDFFNSKWRDDFIKRFEVETNICKLHCVTVRDNSEMIQTSILADQERIDILLDPNSSQELRIKAKG